MKKNINLGFTVFKLPDKMADKFFVYPQLAELSFDHYQDADKVIGLTKDDVVLLKTLDTSLGIKKSMKFLKRSHQQVEERRVKILKQKLHNVKTRLNRKKEEQDRIEKRIRSLQIKINEMTQPQQQIQDAPILRNSRRSDQ